MTKALYFCICFLGVLTFAWIISGKNPEVELEKAVFNASSNTPKIIRGFKAMQENRVKRGVVEGFCEEHYHTLPEYHNCLRQNLGE